MFLRHPKRDLPKGPQAILDAGSNELAVLITDTDADGKPMIIGHASHVSAGLRRGEIIDLDLFANTVGKAVQAAERKTGITVEELHVVTSAGRPHSSIHRLHVDSSDAHISARELRRLQSRIADLPTPDGFEKVQHHLLQYIVNGTGHIANPVGMPGPKLEADIALLSLSKQTTENLRIAAAQNHLMIGEIHHTASMAALIGMDEDDKDVGCLQLDLGAGTTSAAIYSNDVLVHAFSLPVGFHDITRDLVQIFGLQTNEAERLKVVEGEIVAIHPPVANTLPFPASGDNFVISNPVSPLDLLTLSSGEQIERRMMQDVISCRIDDILELVQKRIEAAGMTAIMSRRIRISGGGAALRGLADYISHKWNKHVSLAQPSNIQGSTELETPLALSAALGMAKFLQSRPDLPVYDLKSRPRFLGAFGRFGNWLSENI